MGAFQGSLASFSATELGSFAIKGEQLLLLNSLLVSAAQHP
jgi:hypothetical protein